jgi:SAM-dependent methyltransferase
MNDAGQARQRVRALYAGASPITRLYIKLRSGYYPLETYLSFLPAQGRIADVGCGDGVLSCLVAVLRPDATVTGLEPDARRRDKAAAAAKGLPNVEIVDGDWQRLGADNYAAVLLVDTLHHIPYGEQAGALRTIADALAPGGVALINETDPSQRPRWWWNWLSDVLLYPAQTRCCFRRPDEMRRMLQEAGLSVTTVPLSPRLGFGIILYVAAKPAAH